MTKPNDYVVLRDGGFREYVYADSFSIDHTVLRFYRDNELTAAFINWVGVTKLTGDSEEDQNDR